MKHTLHTAVTVRNMATRARNTKKLGLRFDMRPRMENRYMTVEKSTVNPPYRVSSMTPSVRPDTSMKDMRVIKERRCATVLIHTDLLYSTSDRVHMSG